MIQQASEPSDDRQAKAKPETPVSSRIVKLMILFKDVLKLPLGNSNAGIPYLDAQIPVPTPASEQHPPSLGIFESVGHKISNHLFE